jgi:hypothetical protein
MPELGLRGMVILVDQSCHGGFSAYGSHDGHVSDGLRLDVWRPLVPGLVRPPTVVVPYVLAEHRCQVPFVAAYADGTKPPRTPAQITQIGTHGPVFPRGARLRQIGGSHATAATRDRHAARLAIQSMSDPSADYLIRKSSSPDSLMAHRSCSYGY